ncbi:hypothetical protein QQ020_28245 [Fulvivirgaceae bacterium BMA12]|uniref:Uncharacterized protein n=1 Tax=Agaribacillus aureus TaxID=3051825 RepID=A0ABT8LGF0_9BACT|nr:hypothetical protein [Fulvivirgaceae bacterium BMA12]
MTTGILKWGQLLFQFFPDSVASGGELKNEVVDKWNVSVIARKSMIWEWSF